MDDRNLGPTKKITMHPYRMGLRPEKWVNFGTGINWSLLGELTQNIG